MKGLGMRQKWGRGPTWTGTTSSRQSDPRIGMRGQSRTETSSLRRSSPRSWDRGQSLVEFGLMAPIYALLLFGSIQMLFMPYQKFMMEKAVWKAARAVVTSTSADTKQIEEKVDNQIAVYKQYGYLHGLRKGLTKAAGAEEVDLEISNRLFFHLGVKLGEKDGMGSEGGSFENYKGPLPAAGGGT